MDAAISTDEPVAAAASRALFRNVVEPLADSFEPRYSETYRDFFSWVIEAVRRRPGFEALDQGLNVTGPGAFDGVARQVKRIVVPSRVTLGADIAVVSVILAGLLERFPEADIFFAGGPKNTDLFVDTPRLHPLAAPYPRGGLLRQRLAVWPELLALVNGLRDGLDPGELLAVDPDSRMTQLGLLPLGPANELRLVYDSRAFGGTGSKPLAELTADWLAEVLGEAPKKPRPWTSFQPTKTIEGPVAAVSFGLGGNPAKRVNEAFEREALELLHGRGYRVVLDSGFGDEERALVEPLVGLVQAAGGLVHQGSFRSFGELVAGADLFVGYDSSFGHLAAAMGVRGVTVFAGAVSERMRQRWAPSGRAASTVIAVGEGEPAAAVLARLERALP